MYKSTQRSGQSGIICIETTVIMELEKYQDSHLSGLLRSVRDWQRLDNALKALLPSFLKLHCSVVCITEDGVLIIYASSSMAAHRLKLFLSSHWSLIQNLDERIQTTKIRVAHTNRTQENRFQNRKISQAGLSVLADSANYFSTTHPQLAAAMTKLINSQK